MTIYKPFKNYVLRTPVYKFDKNEIWNYNLIDFFNDKYFLKAIQIASPSLYNELLKWHRYGLKSEKKENHLHNSLLKYYARSSTRCTPFGLFASLCLGTITDKTKIVLNNKEKYKSNSRIDMYFLGSFIQSIEKLPELRNQLKYFPNNSIYYVKNKIRYIESYYINNNLQYQISGAINDKYLNNVLLNTIKGATISELSAKLIDKEISIEDSNDYINQLIDNQVLVSEIAPSVTGPYLSNFLIKKLIELDLSSNIILKNLKEVHSELNQFDNIEDNRDENKYFLISNLLKKIHPTYTKEYLIQTDLVTSTTNNEINSEIVKDLYDGLKVMNKLSIPFNYNNLSKFKEEFYKRYENKKYL